MGSIHRSTKKFKNDELGNQCSKRFENSRLFKHSQCWRQSSDSKMGQRKLQIYLYRYTYKLFKLSEEGELQLLEEKSSLEVFNGYGISLLYLGLGNLGILFSENRFLNFSSGKLVFSRFDYED